MYELTKTMGFHLPILCGKVLEEMPGKTEKVEFSISDVIVQMGSAKCIAQVYVTNYRLVQAYCVCVHAYMRACVCVCVHACMCVCMHACAHAFVYTVHHCMCVCVCVCV